MILENFPFIIISIQNLEVFGWDEPVFPVIFNFSPRIMENPERGVQLFSPENLLITSTGLQVWPLKSESNYFINLLYGHRAFQGLPPAALVKSGAAPSCYIPFDSSHHEESRTLFGIQIGPLGAEIWAKPKLFGGSFHFSAIFGEKKWTEKRRGKECGKWK